MEWLSHYGLFVAEFATVVVILVIALLILVAGVIGILHQHQSQPELTIKHLNQRYAHWYETLHTATVPLKSLKKILKVHKKQQQAHRADETRPRLFVLTFHGDLQASQVDSLREEITAILTTAKAHDQVLVRLESSGGLVHGYGLGAAQLLRLKARQLPVIVAVDKVAASGGYLMACVADRLIAAPFAIVGSIGVISQLPNFNRFLKRYDIDVEMFTAGEYKRTVTLFGENTEKARAKLQQELEETHELFKNFVAQYRPAVNIAAVATGEHWYGQQAMDLKLIDEIRTSDDYLFEACQQAEVYEVTYHCKTPLMAKLMDYFTRLQHRVLQRWPR